MGFKRWQRRCLWAHCYRLPTKLWEGNVFSRVCPSFCPRGVSYVNITHDALDLTVQDCTPLLLFGLRISLLSPLPYWCWHLVAIEAHTVSASGRYASYWNACLLDLLLICTQHVQWRIQDFPRGGANSQKYYYSSIFCQRLHENERIWTPGGVRVPGAPLGSANDVTMDTCWIKKTCHFYFLTFNRTNFDVHQLQGIVLLLSYAWIGVGLAFLCCCLFITVRITYCTSLAPLKALIC